jgi:hypothetical protein
LPPLVPALSFPCASPYQIFPLFPTPLNFYEIYENFKLAWKEEQQGELKYSGDINELKRSISV